MKLIAACVTMAVVAASTHAQDLSQMPKPQKEHEWLKQLEGEWEANVKMIHEPGKDPMETSGSERVRMVGGFWAVSENRGEMMGMPFIGMMALGYDPQKKKYVGGWIDSAQPTMWQYEGTVDDSGKVLTLDTEGPCPMQGGKIVKAQETLEIKGPDHKVFTSKMDFNGTMQTMMTVDYRRKK